MFARGISILTGSAVDPGNIPVPRPSDLLTDRWADIWNSRRCAAIRSKSAKMEHICQLKGKEAGE